MSDRTRQRSYRLRLATVYLTVAISASTVGTGAATARPTAAGPVYGGTIHIAYTGNLVTLDPAQAVTAPDENTVNGVLFNGLYQLDRNSVPRLDLALAATVSADQRVWTFRLRKGVRFSNGLEVTAGDLALSITRVLDPQLSSTLSNWRVLGRWTVSPEAVPAGGLNECRCKTPTARKAMTPPPLPLWCSVALASQLDKVELSGSSQVGGKEVPRAWQYEWPWVSLERRCWA